MPTYKVLVTYNLFQNGWNETFFRTANDPVAAASLTTARINGLLNMHSISTVMISVRASDVSSPGLYFLQNINKSPNSPILPLLTADQAQTCALMRLSSALGYQRRLWLRGLPDDFVTRDLVTGASQPSAGFNLNLPQWRSAIIGSGFQIGKRKPPTVIGFAWIPVVSLAPLVGFPGFTLVTTLGAHGFATGDQVFFGKISQNLLPGLKGSFNCAVASATTFSIPLAYRGVGSTITPPQGRVRKLGYNYDAIDTVEFIRFATRDTGRPTATSRGRSRAVVHRQ